MPLTAVASQTPSLSLLYQLMSVHRGEGLGRREQHWLCGHWGKPVRFWGLGRQISQHPRSSEGSLADTCGPGPHGGGFNVFVLSDKIAF